MSKELVLGNILSHGQFRTLSMEMYACVCKAPCLCADCSWEFGCTFFSARICLASGHLRTIQLRTVLSVLLFEILLIFFSCCTISSIGFFEGLPIL